MYIYDGKVSHSHVLMRLYPIDKSLVFYKVKEGRRVRICSILKVISVHSGDDLDLSFTHRSSKFLFRSPDPKGQVRYCR